jgi:hypothetical protein
MCVRNNEMDGAQDEENGWREKLIHICWMLSSGWREKHDGWIFPALHPLESGWTNFEWNTPSASVIPSFIWRRQFSLSLFSPEWKDPSASSIPLNGWRDELIHLAQRILHFFSSIPFISILPIQNCWLPLFDKC